LKSGGYFISEPGLKSIIRGATDGVSQGAVFYLYSLTIIPTAVYIILTGKIEEFAEVTSISSRWDLWYTVPEWFWESAILSARIANVFIVVACVYVAYRIGMEMRDKKQGRVSALLLTLTMAVIQDAHEANEDGAALLFILITLYLVMRYVETGRRGYFLTGSLTGGSAMAFKLSAGTLVFLIGFSLLLRYCTSDERLKKNILNYRLILTGGAIGFVALYIGRPRVLFLGVDQIFQRVAYGMSSHSESPFSAAPPGYMMVYGYVAGVGLPLLVANIIGITDGIHSVLTNRSRSEKAVLILFLISIYMVVFSTWNHIRTHHMLPIIALLMILSAEVLRRWYDGGPGKKTVVVLIIALTVPYVVSGELAYATEPRDSAADWIESNVGKEEAVVVYENSIASIGTPHTKEVNHYNFYEEEVTSNSILNESDYTQWMINTPERKPEYIHLECGNLKYIDPLKKHKNRFPERSKYIENLINEDLNYRVAAVFGDVPKFGSHTDRIANVMFSPDVEHVQNCVVVLEKKK
jgi:hypothetical protein